MKEVKPPKKSYLYYYGIILLVIILLNAFVFPTISGRYVKDVDYSTFLDMVENNQVAEVEIENNYINFVPKDANDKKCIVPG